MINHQSSQRARKYAQETYLPQLDEVTYNLNHISQRLIFIREQVIKMNCERFAFENKLSETTLREYECGEFNPRAHFFIAARENKYQSYLLFLLTGQVGLTVRAINIELPKLNRLSERLRYLRETIFDLSRAAFSEQVLNDFSQYNIKNYELEWRRPDLHFMQLCLNMEKMKPYFSWLFWNKNDDMQDTWIELPSITNKIDRERYQARMNKLLKKDTHCGVITKDWGASNER